MFRSRYPEVPILALAPMVTHKVQVDIRTPLGMRNDVLFNLRFHSTPRALACSIGRLRWACGLPEKARPRWLARWNAKTCAVLAEYGGLAALQWARAAGCECSDWYDAQLSSRYGAGALELTLERPPRTRRDCAVWCSRCAMSAKSRCALDLKCTVKTWAT